MADKLKENVKILSQLEQKSRNVSRRRDSVCRTDITDILRKTAVESEKENTLENRNGGYLGVVLRVEPESTGQLGSFTRNLFTTLGFDPPFKKKLRVYSPFFHGAFECPVPNGDTQGNNALKITSLPNSLFEAENDLANAASYKPGDIVIVNYKTLFPMTGPVLVGPYSSATYSYNGAETSFLGLFNAATAELEEGALGEATSLAEDCANAAEGFEDFIQPASGRLSSVFGNRADPKEGPNKGNQEFHPGIDICQGQNLDIVSSFEGEVVCCLADGTYRTGPVKPKTTAYCYMYIKHQINNAWYVTGYFHLLETVVGGGDKVVRNQVIAKSGGAVGSPGSGGTTGPHLHYEFYTCTKEPKTGLDPRYVGGVRKLGNENPYGMTAIDPGTYTGWGTKVGDVYRRGTSCLRKQQDGKTFEEVTSQNTAPINSGVEDVVGQAIATPTVAPEPEYSNLEDQIAGIASNTFNPEESNQVYQFGTEEET
jgi:murein DD-endopeptidase MepM/ murein hydrolase activator NlpD